MSFTYNLSSSDQELAAISAIRLEVGDNDEERGIKPNSENYTDEEILHIYNNEGQNVGRAAAQICEQMATAWSSVPRTMFGSLIDPRHVGRNYMRQAERLRNRYGYNNTESTAFSVGMIRT